MGYLICDPVKGLFNPPLKGSRVTGSELLLKSLQHGPGMTSSSKRSRLGSHWAWTLILGIIKVWVPASQRRGKEPPVTTETSLLDCLILSNHYRRGCSLGPKPSRNCSFDYSPKNLSSCLPGHLPNCPSYDPAISPVPSRLGDRAFGSCLG